MLERCFGQLVGDYVQDYMRGYVQGLAGARFGNRWIQTPRAQQTLGCWDLMVVGV